ncbi:MAG: DNA/RNA nuclease SfsA [Desulfobacca sp.]|uniref:DNA/RNA nuclease SfsA n=1 Tax=Desulfobacca sp. TaxID=2067990 RepID=UPI004049A02C
MPPTVRSEAPLVYARFRRREKRFLAEVDLPDGSRTWVHVPNSGALTGCLFPGMEVVLTADGHPGRKTIYTWRFCRVDGAWISVDTTAPNRLVAALLAGNGLPGLPPPLQVRREVTLPHGGRLDFVVEQAGQRHFIEVKSITWVEAGVALFPDGVTSRGRRHLQELAALVKQGHGAWNIFVVQRQDARLMAPAREVDPAYARELAEAARAGVNLLAFATKIDPPTITLTETLPVVLSGSGHEPEGQPSG